MIRAIIFDFGGVLMRTVNPVSRHDLEQRFGLPPGGASKLVFGSPLWDEAQLGRVSATAFWADVGQQLGLNDSEIIEFRHTFWAGDRLDEELVAFIHDLRDAGYRTAMLSNAPADLRQIVEQLMGITGAFDGFDTAAAEDASNGIYKHDTGIGYSPNTSQVGGNMVGFDASRDWVAISSSYLRPYNNQLVLLPLSVTSRIASRQLVAGTMAGKTVAYGSVDFNINFLLIY